MKKFVLASLLGTAVMFAAQAPAPATGSTSQSPAKAATTSKAKKHHKKSAKKTGEAVNSTAAKPATTK